MGYSRFVAWLALGWVAMQAHAQPLDETQLVAARQLGLEGIELYHAGDNVGALDRLQRAYSVYQAPTLGLWYGRALERSGKLVEASQRYHEVTQAVLKADATPAFRQAQLDARQALDAVNPRLPRLSVQLTGAELARVRVTLDAEALPQALVGVAIPVNPGVHVVKAVYGEKVQQRTLELREGEAVSVSLEFPFEPLKPPPPLPVAQIGLPRDVVNQVMLSARSSVGNCLNGVPGVVTANFSVLGTTGEVKNVRVQFDPRFQSQLKPSGGVTRERLMSYYTACIARELEKVRFPRFTKPSMEIAYPFQATPIKQRAARAK